MMDARMVKNGRVRRWRQGLVALALIGAAGLDSRNSLRLLRDPWGPEEGRGRASR